MGALLGYLLTWTTYGTWLPGDERGWVDRQRTHGDVTEPPSVTLEAYSRQAMARAPFVMDTPMRIAVEDAIRRRCRDCQWLLHGLAVRTNHVHVVVTAAGQAPAKVMGVLKAAGTKALRNRSDQPCWTASGSKRYLRTPESLAAAARYILNQDHR